MSELSCFRMTKLVTRFKLEKQWVIVGMKNKDLICWQFCMKVALSGHESLDPTRFLLKCWKFDRFLSMIQKFLTSKSPRVSNRFPLKNKTGADDKQSVNFIILLQIVEWILMVFYCSMPTLERSIINLSLRFSVVLKYNSNSRDKDELFTWFSRESVLLFLLRDLISIISGTRYFELFGLDWRNVGGWFKEWKKAFLLWIRKFEFDDIKIWFEWMEKCLNDQWNESFFLSFLWIFGWSWGIFLLYCVIWNSSRIVKKE